MLLHLPTFTNVGLKSCSSRLRENYLSEEPICIRFILRGRLPSATSDLHMCSPTLPALTKRFYFILCLLKNFSILSCLLSRFRCPSHPFIIYLFPLYLSPCALLCLFERSQGWWSCPSVGASGFGFSSWFFSWSCSWREPRACQLSATGCLCGWENWVG